MSNRPEERDIANTPTDGGPVRPSVRLLDDTAQLVETEAIQREVWGLEDRDVVPASQLRAAAYAGGYVAGAFKGDEMIGFAYGFVATPHGRGMVGLGLHSHMVAVRPAGRRRGVGQSLKWFQRNWCMEHGMNWITWTFDPLQGGNANLNLRHLGAVCHDYLVDFYGAMPGTLGGGQASDRLLALWQLDSARVTNLATAYSEHCERPGDRSNPGAVGNPSNSGDPSSPGVSSNPGVASNSGDPSDDKVKSSVPWLLTTDEVAQSRESGGAPGLLDAVTNVTQTVLKDLEDSLADDRATFEARVAVPENTTFLLQHDPELANLWRVGIRTAMTLTLAAGMTVASFHNGAYVLRYDEEEQAVF